MHKRPLTAAFVARVKTPGRYGDGGLGGLGLYLRVHRMKSGRVSKSLGPAHSSGREAHQSRTGLVPGRDAQGGEREGAGVQAGGPLGPRPERRGGSHLRGGRREGDRDPLADLEEPIPHGRAVAADAAGLRPSAHRPERVSEVATADVLAILKPIWSSKPATARGRAPADRRGDEVDRRERATGRTTRRGDAITAALPRQRQRHPASQGAPARRGGGGSGQGPRLGVPCRCPAGARVHGPDRDTLERGPGRGVRRSRARCLDHSRRPHEGEARAPGSPVGARLGDPRGKPGSSTAAAGSCSGARREEGSTPRCSASCSGVSASQERPTG